MSRAPDAFGLGLVLALPAEARTMGLSHWRPGSVVRQSGLLLAMAGVGPERAQAAARSLLRMGAQGLVSWGLAGGLDPTFQPGDLLLPVEVCSEGRVWRVDTRWRAVFAMALESRDADACLRLWSGAEPIASLQRKRDLARRGMSAADMESAAVAQVAGEAGVPFVAVKAICDPAARALPPAALALLRPDGRIALGATLRVLLGGPRLWRQLGHLRHDRDAACRRLTRAARALSRVLPR